MKERLTSVSSWLSFPGYILLFLMIAFPIAPELIYVKVALFMLVIAITGVTALRRGVLALHPRIALRGLFFAAVGLAFVIRGIIRQTAVPSDASQLYVLWPLIYTFILAGMTSWRVLMGVHRVLVLATIVIALHGLSYILAALGVLPRFLFVPLFLQGEAIGFYSGYIRSNLYSFNSVAFLVPFVMAALVTYAPADADPPIRRKWLWLSLCSGLALILLSGRRALLLVVLFAFLPIVLLKPLVKQREIHLTKGGVTILVLGVVLIIVTFAQVVSATYSFSWSAVLDWVASGFGATSSSADLGAQIRADQYHALITAWSQTPLLGAGHGASAASYIRDSNRPWSYELYYVALLFQVGILGILIYASGVLWIYWAGLRILREGGEFAKLMLCNLVGLFGMLVVNATNPVLPRYDGLWAVFLPIGVINAWLIQQRHRKAAT